MWIKENWEIDYEIQQLCIVLNYETEAGLTFANMKPWHFSLWAQNSSTVFVCVSHSQCLNPAPGSFGMIKANLSSFPYITLPSKCWSMSDPKTTILFTVEPCVWTWGGKCADGVASVETPEWQQDGCHPPGEKMSGITAFSTQLTPRQMELTNTAQPKPWQQRVRSNRKLPGQSERRTHCHLSRSQR